MSGKPQVTLTLAGDSAKLERTFGAVGASSKKMADEVGSSSKRVADETGDAYDRAGEAADNVDTKSMGFRDTLTGVQDTMKGTSMIAKGDLFNGFFTLGAGVGDLGSGFYNFLIPAFKAFSVQAIQSAAATVRNTVVTTAQRGASLASAAATNVMTVAQRALNLAMRANPIGLIITALILLGTGLVLAYRKSETFRNIVNGAFNAVRNVAVSVFNWVRNNWGALLSIITGPIGLAVGVIAKHKDKIVGFFRAIPGAVAGAFRGIGSAIAAPFQGAFNSIRNAWNNTVGGKGFSIPGWVPNLGGKSFRIPYFHTGGIVSGAMGSETLSVLRAGERVTAGSGSGGGGGATIVLKSDGTRIGRLLVQVLREAIRVEGGNVQVVLGQ